MDNNASLARKIQKSLDISWKEGVSAAGMLGIIEYYLVPYALFLGATTQQVGFLVALPHLLASIFQLFTVRAVQLAGSRLGFIIRAAALQAALLIPLAVLSFFPARGNISLLILLTIVFRVLGNLVATVWGSLVSDYLPAEKRGYYFGWRSQIVGVASVATVGLAGTWLYVMKRLFPALSFLLLFLCASLLRFLSVFLLSKMTDLPVHLSPDDDFTFFMFLRRFKESNFVKYVFYVSSMMFVTFLAAPYFSVYMLRDLRFNYLSYTGVQLASVMAGLVTYPLWGKHADLVGNVRILKVTGLLIPSIPLLWLLSHHPAYLMAVEAFSGFVWGGFMLCATNFVYDSVSPRKRVRCLGYFNLMNGVAIFGGASLGGFLAGRLPPVGGFSLLTLFCLSGMFRLLVHCVLSSRFEEVRVFTKRVSHLQLLSSLVGLHPLANLSKSWNVSSSVGTFPPEQMRS